MHHYFYYMHFACWFCTVAHWTCSIDKEKGRRKEAGIWFSRYAAVAKVVGRYVPGAVCSSHIER